MVVLVPILLLPLPLLAAYDGPDDGRPHKVGTLLRFRPHLDVDRCAAVVVVVAVVVGRKR